MSNLFRLQALKCLSRPPPSHCFFFLFPSDSGLLRISFNGSAEIELSSPDGKPGFLNRSVCCSAVWGCGAQSSVLLNPVCKCFLSVCNCVGSVRQRSRKPRRINKSDLLGMQRRWRRRVAFFQPAACGYWFPNMKIQFPWIQLGHLSHCLLISASVVLNKTLLSV